MGVATRLPTAQRLRPFEEGRQRAGEAFSQSVLPPVADATGITSIAIPRIAAGYGGLSWKKVRALIDAAFGDWDGTLFVYETFEPEANGAN